MITNIALLKQLKILAIAPLLKHILGDKLQRGTIDTVSETTRLGTIIEDMPKMTISIPAPNLSPHHEMAQIPFLLDALIIEWLGEAGPTTARFKLIQATEQGLPGDNIHIDSFPFVVPELVIEGWLGGVFLSHPILYW